MDEECKTGAESAAEVGSGKAVETVNEAVETVVEQTKKENIVAAEAVDAHDSSPAEKQEDEKCPTTAAEDGVEIPLECPVEISELKETIDGHFQKIEALVRYNKGKDANVLVLSKQLQQYRDGLENVLFKRLSLEIIGLREDCRKSLRDCAERPLTAQNAAKYIGYLTQDLYDALENMGVALSDDGNATYNGKSLDITVEKLNFSDPPEKEEIPSTDIKVVNEDSLLEYLNYCESTIIGELADNKARDLIVNEYIKANSLYDMGVYQVVLYPVIRKIVNLYLKYSEEFKDIQVTEEDAKQRYFMYLNYFIDEYEKILLMCGVTIDSFDYEQYDPKKHRLLKYITADDEAMNGKIGRRYTDCYIMNEKVIYPAKVDIYKKN